MLTPSGAEITVDGQVVVKLHRPGTDPAVLATRLRAAARLDSLLSPLNTAPERIGDRCRSRWPLVEVVPQDLEAVPWADAAVLLARLHAEPLNDEERAVRHGGPDRLRRALDALDDDAPAVRRAALMLPPEIVSGLSHRPPTPVHGDFHLGQLGRLAGQPWALIDVDDFGAGDPAWDMARPAGFWAAGLLPDEAWSTFLDAYRRAGGPALPPAPADPWPVLEPYARAAVVQAAARALVRWGPADENTEMLVAACARMA